MEYRTGQQDDRHDPEGEAEERATTTRRRGRPAGSQGDKLLSVARDVFLEVGFPGATMGEVASRAHISKASLYREHPSKDALFAAVVLDWAARGRGAMQPVLTALLCAADLRTGLLELVTTIQAATLDPAVLRMRRLVASESDRFPDVAAAYVAGAVCSASPATARPRAPKVATTTARRRAMRPDMAGSFRGIHEDFRGCHCVRAPTTPRSAHQAIRAASTCLRARPSTL